MSTPELARLLSEADQVIPSDGLEEKLALGRPLRVKLGIDPSRPDLHLGHAVVLRKLRRFQDLGHTAVLIVGDFTGKVGDPTGRSETRPLLSEEEIDHNGRTYLEQAGLVVDMASAEVRHNSEWLAELKMDEILRLTSSYTVARMLERDDFDKRYRAGKPISVVEFLYPLLQAMDSVAVEADIEMGGTDQMFNLLVGRDIQKAYGMEPQLVLTMPLLEGTDGDRKMSKSFDNYVGLTEEADEMFGKLMRIPDELIVKYMRLCTDIEPGEIQEAEAGMAAGSLHPAEQKRRLAASIVDLYRGTGAGAAAEETFNLVHRHREVPQEVEEQHLPQDWTRGEGGLFWLPRVIWGMGLASSKGEARRLIEQGGVRLDGAPVVDPEAEFSSDDLRGKVLQVGRRRFVRIV